MTRRRWPFLRQLVGRCLPGSWRRRRLSTYWERQWSAPEFTAPWCGRGVSPEVETAVRTGWFRPGCTVLDVGCGDGLLCAWLAEQGFRAVGLDIAASAIARACMRHPPAPGRLEFATWDVCSGPFRAVHAEAVIDRGCFHQIPDGLLRAYATHVTAMTGPTARLLMFCRAFRNNSGPQATADERRHLAQRIDAAFAGLFVIERTGHTWLDPHHGDRPTQQMPGLVVWMTRTAS